MENINKIPNLPDVLVSAVLLVDQRGRILIAQRPEGKSMAGLWEFPGGKIHKGETEAEALIREIKEELDITMVAAHLKRVMEVKFAYDDFNLIMPLFLCRQWQGEVNPQEGQDIAWVKPEQLQDYPMPPADAPIIDLVSGFLDYF